jgi:hypothetical protein
MIHKEPGLSIAHGADAGQLPLSLILCSRNDQYMGNSRWRLELTLNFVAGRVEELGRTREVEVLVTDWGSETPLCDVLKLTPAAASIVSFIHVPREVAHVLQKDSPFAEVLALNAAARRARGEYIGRIDQDTLVGMRFLTTFFELYEGKRRLAAPLNSALFFSNLRMIPYRIAARCPPSWVLESYIWLFGQASKVEITRRKPFYWHGVGIWLMSRALWHECGGYDEDMLYMNAMEIKMIQRLSQRYPIVNLGEVIGYDFYHLEHYHPWVPRMSSVYRKVNQDWERRKYCVNPNGDVWGLGSYSLQVEKIAPSNIVAKPSTPVAARRQFALFMLLIAIERSADFIVVHAIILANLTRRIVFGPSQRRPRPGMQR